MDPERKQEAFFLKPDGTAFASKHGLVKFVRDRVKPRFPWFHPYLGRHWCANARLVDWGFDHNRVADWLGHESVNMTRREYDHNARLYGRMYGERWLERMGRKSGPRKPRTQ